MIPKSNSNPYLCAIVRLRLQIGHLGAQTANEVVLLVADLVRHGGLRMREEVLQVHGETGHVDREYSIAVPGIVKADDLAVVEDRRRDAGLRQHADWKHRHSLRVAYLIEQPDIVGIVVVGEVENALLRGVRVLLS